MEILFEDKNIVAVYKEPGIASQPDKSGNENAVDLLSEQLSCDIYCVHRLDTPTGGVMVYAKNAKAAGALTESLKNSEKEYLAVVSGTTDFTGTMSDYLYHDKLKNKSFPVKSDRKGSKEAVLCYETIASDNETSLVKVQLKTGRTHQIRVQFASRGYPLCGDGKYGSKVKCPLALHCFRLKIIHPFTSEELVFEKLPESPWYGYNI